MGRKAAQECEILSPDHFLEDRPFNIWDCYSEEKSDFNGILHFHEFYELSVIYEGSSCFMVNGVEFSMEKKSLQLIRPTDHHRQLTGKGEYIRYYNLMFTANFLPQDLLKLLEECPGPLCSTASDDDWDAIMRHIEEIEEFFPEMDANPLAEITVRNDLEALCIHILRHQRGGAETAIAPTPDPVRQALRYIQRNYRKKIQLSDIAGAVGLSPSYFSTLFHSIMGMTFSLYLTKYRLQIAERYLRTSDLPVKQIAWVCGFSSYPYFVTAFKSEYGVPPGLFRKACPKLP